MLRVQIVHVVKLAEVIEHGLPVAVDRHGLVLHQREVAKLVVLHDREHVFQKDIERLGVGVEVNPVKTQRFFAAHLGQANGLLGQAALKALLMRGIDQVAVGAIAPAVIGAAKVFGVARVVIDQPHTAVLAHVVKSLHGAHAIAGEQDALGAQIKYHVVARVGEVRYVHGGDPALGPHGLPLTRVPVGADVALLGKIFDLPAIGLATLLVEWLFGVHSCASVSLSSQSVTELGGKLLLQRSHPGPHQ